MKWKYEGFNKMGQVTAGVVDADSQEKAAGDLRARGLYIQKIEMVPDGRPDQMRTVLPQPATPPAPDEVRMPPAVPAAVLPEKKVPLNVWQDDLVAELVGVSNVLRFLDTIRDDPGVNIGKKTREMLLEDNLVKIGELAIAFAVSKAARKAL